MSEYIQIILPIFAFLKAVIVWTLVVVCIEAITEIITSSSLFFGFRDWISRKTGYGSENEKWYSKIGELFHCGYCFSVWPAIAFAFVLPGDFTIWWIDLIIKAFCAHRFANWFHELMARWLSRHPWTFVIHKPGGNNEQEKGDAGASEGNSN
jgi:hypothetical protein